MFLAFFITFTSCEKEEPQAEQIKEENKEKEGNKENEKEYLSIDKNTISIFVSESQLINVQTNSQAQIKVSVDDEFIVSASGDSNNNGINIRGNHVGKTTIHVINNKIEKTCSVTCIPQNDYIGWTIMDFGISQEQLMDSINKLDYLRINSKTENSIKLTQRIQWYDIDVEYSFKNNKLDRVYKYMNSKADVDASQILSSLNDYYEFVERMPSYKEQGQSTTESLEETITPYIYRRPNKGFIEYQKTDIYGKKSHKTSTTHYLIFSENKQ